MAVVNFSVVKVNQKFTFNDKVWTKVKPVMKTCCTMKFNAKLVEDPKKTKVFGPNVKVRV